MNNKFHPPLQIQISKIPSSSSSTKNHQKSLAKKSATIKVKQLTAKEFSKENGFARNTDFQMTMNSSTSQSIGHFVAKNRISLIVVSI